MKKEQTTLILLYFLGFFFQNQLIKNHNNHQLDRATIKTTKSAFLKFDYQFNAEMWQPLISVLFKPSQKYQCQ